ncbi:hypothetical protein SAMN05216260_11467 [Streptomyces griseoaurantiacus]|uniref:Uncharacterized protein n=1 Tax=Streptomyces griseoaurantiacus TaxID=68213 RepID=A0A1G7RBH2_9ACTN|nr:hypothetical protein SAMN05216260_11467 [Streptomyces jietaisiensis]
MSATVSSWVRTASAVGRAKTGADLHAGLGLDHFLQQPFGGLAPRPSAERSDSSRRSRSCRDKATMYPLGSSAPFTPAVRGPWRPRRHGRTVVSAGSGLRYWSGDALAGSARMLGDRRRARRRHGRTDSSASRLSGTSKSRGRGSRSGTTAVDAPKSSWLRRRGTGSTRRRAGGEHTRCSIPEVGWRCLVVRRTGEPEVYAETADLHERFCRGNPDWGRPPTRRRRARHRRGGGVWSTVPEDCSVQRLCAGIQPFSGSPGTASPITFARCRCTGNSIAPSVSLCSMPSPSGSARGWATGHHAVT